MQAIETKCIAATNTRGTRIKAKCWAGETTVSYDYSLNGDEIHIRAAHALREKLGWASDDGKLVTGQLANGNYVHVFHYDGQ